MPHIDILRDPISGVRPHLHDYIGARIEWEFAGVQFTFTLPSNGNNRPSKEQTIIAWNNYATKLNNEINNPRDLIGAGELLFKANETSLYSGLLKILHHHGILNRDTQPTMPDLLLAVETFIDANTEDPDEESEEDEHH